MTTIDLIEERRRSMLYQYIQSFPIFFKLGYIITIAGWIWVWYSYSFAFSHAIWQWVVFGPIVTILVIFIILSKIIQLYYPRFNLVYHKKMQHIWSLTTELPTVDVYLPVCGESIEVLKNTWTGVKLMQKKYPGIVKAYVLDDKGSKEIQLLSKKFKFDYFSRPNKGEMKKAGNLKYAFDKTEGDFICIFDADFRPQSYFLDELLPYFQNKNTRDNGSKIGIVQSPQCFDIDNTLSKNQPLAYGAAVIQHYFYKFIQPARQAFGGGAICVGSNAIYRRAALNDIGGTVQIEHSEDVWTGFKIISKGWKLKYIPLCVAFGDCPDDAHAFYKQQSRWCTGSMSLLASKEFWFSPLPITTKLCFISGFYFYISTLCYPFLPIITVYSLYSVQINIDWTYFVAMTFMSFNAIMLLTQHIYPKWKTNTIIAHMISNWTYAFTIINLLFKRKEPWTPTGAKMKLSMNYIKLRKFIILYCVSLVIAVISIFVFNPHNILQSAQAFFISWLLLNIINHSLTVYGLYKYTA